MAEVIHHYAPVLVWRGGRDGRGVSGQPRGIGTGIGARVEAWAMPLRYECDMGGYY